MAISSLFFYPILGLCDLLFVLQEKTKIFDRKTFVNAEILHPLNLGFLSCPKRIVQGLFGVSGIEEKRATNCNPVFWNRRDPVAGS